MRKFRIVFKQVFMKNIKSPAFLMMILMPMILVGVLFGVNKLMNQNNATAKIAIVGDDQAQVTLARQLKGPNYQVVPQITTVKQAQHALDKEKIDGYLTLPADKQQPAAYYQRKESTDFDPSNLQNQLNQLNVVALAQAAKVPNQQIKQLMTPTTVKSVTVQYTDGQQKIDQTNRKAAGKVISYGITVLLFVFIVNYAGMIAQEIATEKGSRIMEIVLSSVPATTQFFAKVSAILALVATQVIVYLIFGSVAYQFVRRQLPLNGLLKEIGSVIWTAPIWYAIAFLIVGVLLYTVVAAMLGSVVSRMDQVQQAISPLMIIGTISYIGGFALSANAQAPVLRIISYIPLLSQIMLPVRYANGDLSQLAALVGLGLAIVTLIGLTYLALIIYRMNVLVYADGGVLKAFVRSFSLLKAEQK